MTLTVIGCYGAYPPPSGATSGYLIEEGDTKVLLDCGSGVLAKLQEQLPLSELDGVVITHYHPDHCADLGCLQYAVMIDTQLARRSKSFVAYGPGNLPALTYHRYCQGYSYEELSSFTIGSLTFEVFKNIHEITCYAIKVIDQQGNVIVYSGDTGYNEELARFASHSDCFLCEASFYKEQANPAKQHLTAFEAGQLGRLGQTKLLVLTHLPHFGEPEQLITNAKTVYDGNARLAKQWLKISL